MKFQVDVELKERLVGTLKKKYGSERTGVHVTDLIYCLREVYYRKKMPQPITETDLMFFVDGAERHSIIQGLTGFEAEKKVKYGNVVGSIDMIAEGPSLCPVEIKSTRANKDIPPHYFKQLSYYCAMLGSEVGFIVIQRINNREKPWEVVRVEWTGDELAETRRELFERSTLLLNAFSDDDPSLLPKRWPRMEWKCNYCLYKKDCNKVEN